MAEEEKRNTTLAEYLHIAFHLILTGSYKYRDLQFGNGEMKAQ